jgi:hypothetical protein
VGPGPCQGPKPHPPCNASCCCLQHPFNTRYPFNTSNAEHMHILATIPRTCHPPIHNPGTPSFCAPTGPAPPPTPPPFQTPQPQSRTCTAICSCFSKSFLPRCWGPLPLPAPGHALPQAPTALRRPAVPPLPSNMPLSVMVRPVPGGSCRSFTATLTPCHDALCWERVVAEGTANTVCECH